MSDAEGWSYGGQEPRFNQWRLVSLRRVLVLVVLLVFILVPEPVPVPVPELVPELVSLPLGCSDSCDGLNGVVGQYWGHFTNP